MIIHSCNVAFLFQGRKCSAVKLIVNGSSASIFQYGDAEGYCALSVETDPRLRISLYAEFFRTGLSLFFLCNRSILFQRFCRKNRNVLSFARGGARGGLGGYIPRWKVKSDFVGDFWHL